MLLGLHKHYDKHHHLELELEELMILLNMGLVDHSYLCKLLHLKVVMELIVHLRKEWVDHIDFCNYWQEEHHHH